MTGLLRHAVVLVITMLTLCDIATAGGHKVGSLEIIRPWSRATPGDARVGAGYVKIKNLGDKQDRLLSVASAIAKSSEIHVMRMKDNIMRMRRVKDGLDIPANGTVELKPGGYHLMFINLTRPIKQGEPFTATLTFEKVGKIDVKFTVEAIGAQKPTTATKDDHSSHGNISKQ